MLPAQEQIDSGVAENVHVSRIWIRPAVAAVRRIKAIQIGASPCSVHCAAPEGVEVSPLAIAHRMTGFCPQSRAFNHPLRFDSRTRAELLLQHMELLVTQHVPDVSAPSSCAND